MHLMMAKRLKNADKFGVVIREARPCAAKEFNGFSLHLGDASKPLVMRVPRMM